MQGPKEWVGCPPTAAASALLFRMVDAAGFSVGFYVYRLCANVSVVNPE